LVDIEMILSTNPVQPRHFFDEGALQELATSIRVHGVITPITLRRAFDGYELISGERRLRASRMVGLTHIPAYIMDVSSDAQMLEIALVENVQREDLNPLEVAIGYQRLIEECGLRQEDVATKVGKDRSTVANFLRLLQLPSEAQAALRTKKISMGHARALLALSSEHMQLVALIEIQKRELSVRKTEELVKDLEFGRKEVLRDGEIRHVEEPRKKITQPKVPSAEQRTLVDIENVLRPIVGTQVRVRMKADNSGSIEFDYYSIDDLDRLLELFVSLRDE
jgi:ParB family transcriptional regulator, chromosome partitioning protein